MTLNLIFKPIFRKKNEKCLILTHFCGRQNFFYSAKTLRNQGTVQKGSFPRAWCPGFGDFGLLGVPSET